MDIERVESLALRMNKRLNSIEYRFKQLEEQIPLLQQAALELTAAIAALGEAVTPKRRRTHRGPMILLALIAALVIALFAVERAQATTGPPTGGPVVFGCLRRSACTAMRPNGAIRALPTTEGCNFTFPRGNGPAGAECRTTRPSESSSTAPGGSGA